MVYKNLDLQERSWRVIVSLRHLFDIVNCFKMYSFWHLLPIEIEQIVSRILCCAFEADEMTFRPTPSWVLSEKQGQNVIRMSYCQKKKKSWKEQNVKKCVPKFKQPLVHIFDVLEPYNVTEKY